MSKDRKQFGKADGIDTLLDQFNEDPRVIVDRIDQTVQIDSEKPPTRDQVAGEVMKLHGRTRKRRVIPRRRHS